MSYLDPGGQQRAEAKMYETEVKAARYERKHSDNEPRQPGRMRQTLRRLRVLFSGRPGAIG